jgi:hypothetical protein
MKPSVVHTHSLSRRSKAAVAAPAVRARRKFLRHFSNGFNDKDYYATERSYKWEAHLRWLEALGPVEYQRLLALDQYAEIASRAIRVEQGAPYSFIFSFEKMALRDAVRSGAGARAFAVGLYDFLHGTSSLERRFEKWVETVARLPRRQTRVLTWPLVTVFGFLAQPSQHIFLKPMATRAAAAAYGYPLPYESRPSWRTYSSLLEFARVLKRDLRDLRPRDMIDIQSFLWVLGSDEYRD